MEDAFDRKPGRSTSDRTPSGHVDAAPGKGSITQLLPATVATPSPQLAASEPALVDRETARTHGLVTFDPARPLQRHGEGDPALDGNAAHAIASSGFAGGASSLPHLDRIQQAFGRHDITGVRAYVGGAARDASGELGANAYARGDQIGFARDPDLTLAAHEAAHVVQQRAGVHLSSGVGGRGDRYEQHADEVAHAVAAGRSAERLLDVFAGGSGDAALQLDPDETGPDETPQIRIEDLRHHGHGRWTHADGRPLSPAERRLLPDALVQHAQASGMADEDVARYRSWLGNHRNRPVDPDTWREHHLPIMRDHGRAWNAQDRALPDGDPDRSREATGLAPPQGEHARPIPQEGPGNRERPEQATRRQLGGAPGNSFEVDDEHGDRVARVDQAEEVSAPGDQACTTSGADSCAVTALHQDGPEGERNRLGHPSAASGGPQYDHVEESVVRAARQGGQVRGVVRIDPRAQNRPAAELPDGTPNPEHLDDNFHTFPQSNDELRSRLQQRLEREFGAENVARDGDHIVVRRDGQVHSRIGIGIVRAPLDEQGNARIQHVTLTRNGTAIATEGEAAPHTIPHDDAVRQGAPDDDADEPAQDANEPVRPPARAPASNADAEPAPVRAPDDDAEHEEAAPSVVTRPTVPVNDRPTADDEEAAPRVVTRPTVPVNDRPTNPSANEARRDRGRALARSVGDELSRRVDEGDEAEQARARQGLRDLQALGDSPDPEAVRRIASHNGVPERSEPSPNDDAQPQVGLDGVTVPVRQGQNRGEVGVNVEQGGGGVQVRDGGGTVVGLGGRVQQGADGIEGGDAQLTAGQGDIRATISAGVTYVARRPRRTGERYSVAWRIEIRAESALHGRLAGRGVGVSAGGAITREGTDMFDGATPEAALERANEFRASFRELTDERIVERFFRTATADQGTHGWWTEQPVGTTRSVQVQATLAPSIRTTLAGLLEVGASLPMRASASASVSKSAEGTVRVTESFEVGAGLDPSFGAAGIAVRGTLGTGLDNNIRYTVTYNFAVDLQAGRAALEAFLARRDLIWEGQAGVTELGHTTTQETHESMGVSVGPLGRGDGQRGTSETETENAEGETETTHRGFQRDVTNNFTGEYNRRNFDVVAPTNDEDYQVTTDIHSNDGETSRGLLGRETDTAYRGGNEEESQSSGNWRLRENLTQEQMQQFHRNFVARGRARGSLPLMALYRTLRDIPTDDTGRDGRASAIAEFLSAEGRDGLQIIYSVIGAEPAQELRLFTERGEDTNFMREHDLRAMEARIAQYEQAIAAGRGQAIAPRIQQDITLLEPRLASVANRERYTDLNDQLRERQVARYQGLLERLRPLYVQALSGEVPIREERARPEFERGNVSNRGTDHPARLAANDVGEDAEILDHIEVRGLHVLVDERVFWLDCGVEVSLVAARRAGETADGGYRWRCTLRIVTPIPDAVETVNAGADEGPVPNREGQTFHRTVAGRQD